MRAIMARAAHGSKRHFHHWLRRKPSEGEMQINMKEDAEEEEEEAAAAAAAAASAKKRTSSASEAVSRLRSALTSVVLAGRWAGAVRSPGGLGSRVSGTLFGHRRGHVHLAFQVDARSSPALLIEFATPTSTLVREMASGLVRIALECDRVKDAAAPPAPDAASRRLLEEPRWRAYCNGRRCGHAVRRDCGPDDWKVLRAVEPVTMGAGVLPGKGAGDGAGPDGDVMYMRARFERVAGSKDSEAFYMMNPDGNGGPELSIYLLRV